MTMLIDHIGYIFGFGMKMRVIGRLAFPIYCFLIAEGAHYTKNPKKYALRLAIGAALAEWPFDYAFFGYWTWQYQSVMLTLLLSFFAVQAMKCFSNPALKVLAVIPFGIMAELLQTDYGWYGVALTALFALTADMPQKWLLRVVSIVAMSLPMTSMEKVILGIRVPIQLFAVGSLVPIALYNGKKRTNSKAAQWAFYLFYPLHMLVLRLIWIGMYL